MKSIAFPNHKGGVGKTSSALIIAQGLKEKGFRVLAVDLDPQANLTSSLVKGKTLERKTVGDMLLGRIPIEPLSTSQGIDLLPSADSLAGDEKSIRDEMQYEVLLSHLLNGLDEKYDYCIIDCPTGKGSYTIMALMAADEFYIPLQPEYFGAAGLVKMFEFTEKIKRFNEDLSFGGIFITRTHRNDRRKMVRSMIEHLQKAYGDKFLDVFIRESMSIPESQLKGESIYKYDPESTSANDYLELLDKVLENQNA